MLVTQAIYFGEPCLICCDGRCGKAWGINSREKIQIDPSDEDDYAFLKDSELDDAPVDPGTYEGGHAKPLDASHNKWCARECERSSRVSITQGVTVNMTLADFSKRVYNFHWRNE